VKTLEKQLRRDSRLFGELAQHFLRTGMPVRFRAEGASMQPNLASGELLTVVPVDPLVVRRGNIVLTREGLGFKAHRVVSQRAEQFYIETRGDAGWTGDFASRCDILGQVRFSESDSSGLQFRQDSGFSRWRASARRLMRRIHAAVSLRLGNSLSLGVIALAATSCLLLGPTPVAAQADLSLTQVASTSVVSPGGTITYTETITNKGPNAVNDAVLYQQTPPNTTFSSITCPAGWTAATPGAGGAGSVTCTDGASFANGAIANFSYVVNVAAGVASGTTILNTADATSSTADPTPSNNANTTSVLVEAAGGADLAVSMAAFPAPVFISGTLTYTIQVQNRGPAATTSATLTDTLPGAVAFVSSTAVPAGVTCTGTGPVVCTLGVLAVGAVDTITITTTAPATAQNLSNTAAITASSPTDPVSSNNSVATITVVQPLICAMPGNDGVGGSLTGIVNAYYPPGTGVTGAAAGATSVKLGAASASGAQKAIAANDLILIIQMQNAAINSTNSSSYGDGVAGDPATGSTNPNNTGEFEFVVATGAVPVGGGTLNFSGAGATGGLLNSYTNSIATSAQGQATFQVIRVPQYSSATLTSTLTAAPWNGSTGGVLAIDASGQLTLGGTVAVDGEGFRGGGGRILGGGSGALTDYVTLSTNNANGSKGEGIAGAPAFVAPAAGFSTTASAIATNQTFVEGLPSGSYARGAPGSAGGGATDANPAANNQNSGGGAGANGGNGGNGGFGWNSAGIVGGFGGTPFTSSTGTLILGGGGGAGTTNDGTFYIPSTGTGGGGTGLFSSGAQGGGIAILHAGSIAGTGSVTANGGTATNVENDGGGGGGAGGSIRIFANSGNFAGLTVAAMGGSGGTTWQTQAPGTPFPGNRHGPGGGGGGGVVFLSSAPATSSVIGGVNGFSTMANDAYGATVGQPGMVSSNFTINETPGAQPGGECASADLAATNAGTPAVVVPGNVITYTQTVTNNGPLEAVNATLSEAVPANTTFTSLTIPTGWSCTTPAVGASGNIACTDPDLANAGTGTFTLKVTVNGATPNGTQIIDTANVSSGTTDPNLTNNTATVVTVVGLATTANIVVTKTATPNPVLAGNKITYTIVVTNNGPAAAANAVFNDPIPTGTTFSSLTQTGAAWTCPAPTTAVQCTLNPFPSGASTTFTLMVTVPAGTASGASIKNTASTTSTTPDSDPNSNSSTAIVTVATAGQFDLIDSSTGSPNPVLAGHTIIFTQTVSNAGPSASTAGAAVFTGSVPTGTTFDSLGIPTGWICLTLPAVGSSGPISCCPKNGAGTRCSRTATIASGATLQFPLVVTVPAGTASGTKITNASNIAPSTNDVNPANNSTTAIVFVGSPTQSDVAIVKTAAPQPVNQGTNLTYTLQVSNNGPGVGQGVSVLDPLPTEVTFTSVSTTQGTCSQAGGIVSCNIGNVNVGALVIITINATATTLSSSSATTATNTAVVTSTTTDPNPGNNFSSVISTIQAPTAVQLASFRAQNLSGGGVVLEWSTREEVRNLGFHVYREDAQGRHQINPSIIAGGALFLRGGQPQHAAKTYRWIDTQGSAQSSYILEDVDLNGTRTSHGPMSPDSTAQESAPIVPALLLRQLNSLASPSAMAPLHPVGPIVVPSPVIDPEVSGSFLDEKPAVKISVEAEGWYSVSGAQLAAAGFDAGDSRTLQLYAEGVEQPMQIISKQNGRFGPNDSIAFYGTGIDTPFSGTRVYWLINGSQAGKRIPASSAGSGSANVSSFSDAVTLEQRTTYVAALLNGVNNDNFFGAVVNSEPVDQLLAVSLLDTASSIPMELDVTLQGATDGQPHSVSVVLNGASLGTMSFSNQSNTTNTFSVAPGTVQNGTNTVTLAALEGDNDISLVQSITLHYPHSYAADSNWLRASAPGGSRVQFTGFSNSQIQVFDITNPLAIQQLSGPVSFENTGSAITISVPGSAAAAPHTLLAFSADQIAAPSGLLFHAASSLSQQRQGAEIVIITHPDFQSTLAPLVALRKSQNSSVAVVTTDQLYDAYNYGERSPFALRAYLQAASTGWREKPQSLLLLGEASFDPRNYLGFGDFDFVPTRLIETAAFKTASDDWLSDFAESGFATIPTGRIPARTPADASLVISKIVNYESGDSNGPWTHQALVIADQNVGVDFTSEANSASLILPASLTQTKILADGLDPATASQEIIAAINSGALLVNYTGHGSEQQWSFSDLLDNTSAAALTNGNRLPVFLIMDCLNGFFHDVFAESLSSALLFAPNGGAVGVWASSGFTTAPPQANMDQALLSALAANQSQPIGRAIITAKAGILDPDVRRTWIFFGDPAMRVAFPTSSRLPSRPRQIEMPNPVVR
jgi:uncharacterized repeat protein (TIGR01451 family)